MSRIGQEITNSADILDSRDIIARIEELDSDRSIYVDAIDTAEEALAEAEEALRQAPEGANTSELQNAVCEAANALEKARLDLQGEDGFDSTVEGEELAALKALAEEGENYADDWNYGVALIRDSYFRTHAEELADDLGLVPNDAPWPLTCIDWRRAAEELKGDYTAIEFDGVTYWVR